MRLLYVLKGCHPTYCVGVDLAVEWHQTLKDELAHSFA